MKKEELKKLIEEGHEIQFEYKNKKYSITYGEINGEEIISFCEFDKDTVEVKTFDELLSVRYNDFVFGNILDNIKDDKTWII